MDVPVGVLDRQDNRVGRASVWAKEGRRWQQWKKQRQHPKRLVKKGLP